MSAGLGMFGSFCVRVSGVVIYSILYTKKMGGCLSLLFCYMAKMYSFSIL
jgi:hypothetical protein